MKKMPNKNNKQKLPSTNIRGSNIPTQSSVPPMPKVNPPKQNNNSNMSGNNK